MLTEPGQKILVSEAIAVKIVAKALKGNEKMVARVMELEAKLAELQSRDSGIEINLGGGDDY